MKTIEIVLLIAGSILFIFSMWVMILLIKKDKPFIRVSWLIIIAFFMMGFSAISQAEIFGLFRYEKENKLTELESLAIALEYCPGNDEIKTMLIGKLEAFEETERTIKADEKARLGYVHLSLGNDTKAIEYSNEALAKDETNEKAKTVKELVKTQKLINELPQSTNKEEMLEKVQYQLEELKANHDIGKRRITKLQSVYNSIDDSLKIVPNESNQ